MKCPKCGSDNIIPIVHIAGKLSDEIRQRKAAGEIYIIKTPVARGSAKYHCNDCMRNIAKPPLLRQPGGTVDYRDIAEEIFFSVGGFFDGYDRVRIVRKRDGRIILDAGNSYDEFSQKDAKYRLQQRLLKFRDEVEGEHFEEEGLPWKAHREMTADEWRSLLDAIYTKCYIHEWEKEYSDPNICDGVQWELSIKLIGGRERHYYGNNDGPPLWNELEKVFAPYLSEAGIDYQAIKKWPRQLFDEMEEMDWK